MTEYKTFSDYLHSVLDIYENNYGHSPKTIYLDYFWLQKIKLDKDFYDEDYLKFIGFDDEKENLSLACFVDTNIQIIKNDINRWLNKNLNDLLDLESFIYIGDIVMTDKDCFYVIRDRKLIHKDIAKHLKNNLKQQ